MPLLNFGTDIQSRIPLSPSSPTEDYVVKRWYHYVPLYVVVLLILAPHPSLLFMLVDFHLLTMKQHFAFGIHILITYTLTFLAFSSLIVCIARDPGPVTMPKPIGSSDADDDLDIFTALMPSDDFSQPHKWCNKCCAPKPDRTHHCNMCGRCILKMDHHCPWLASKCIGHRTYPAFVHFLTCITLLAMYISAISISALLYAFRNPYEVNEVTPVHELGLAFAGIIFTLIIGSFLAYHLYLISTNQTTLENITPFLLLRYLPPIPQGNHFVSDPPTESQLSFEQRSLVRNAHGHIRMYDIGWRNNWAQIFGWHKPFGWAFRLWCGGSSVGDGKSYPRNPRSDQLLARLASELVKSEND